MLTKKLTFDNDVLGVLRSMTWQDNGKLGIIPGGQLERSLYVRLNKALEAMGGKWSKSARGHVFPNDPRADVDGLLENGCMTVERDGFFETPLPVVERMLELVPYTDGYVLEPSAGLGAIALNLGISKNKIICIEKNPKRREILFFESLMVADVYDFLEAPAGVWDIKHIYMNPPFEELQDIDHVMHAYELLAHGGKMVSVMSEGPFFRSDKKAEKFREWLKEVDVYCEKLPEGSFKLSGTGVNTRLVVISK